MLNAKIIMQLSGIEDLGSVKVQRIECFDTSIFT